MNTPAQVGPNPYVGPRPFTQEEQSRFFGRRREATELDYLLSAERIVVLHSPSGAGKSSLVYAGLMPRMRRQFDIWRPTRVNGQPPTGLDVQNRYVWSAIVGFEQGLPEEHRYPPETVANQSLLDYHRRRRGQDESRNNILLIFDQFEEVLRIDPYEVEAKRTFFQQLGELLSDRSIWALFVLREDYLAPLDPYCQLVPTHLKYRYRMDRLDKEAALEAIEKPLQTTEIQLQTTEIQRYFAPGVAEKLCDNLAKVKVQQLDGSPVEKTGLYIEPMQLQVVCFRLWADMAPNDLRIDEDAVKKFGDVDEALSAYYETAVQKIAHDQHVDERRIRDWFDKLFTNEGVRKQVLKGQGHSEELENTVIDAIIDMHLVRAEDGSGITRYELAHDRLVEPVKDSNTAWFAKNLHLMQRQAVLWEREGKPDRLLLRGRYLKEAEGWARAHPAAVRPVEKDLLARSARQRRGAWFKRGTVVCIISAVVIVFVVEKERRAEARKAYTQDLVNVSRQLLNSDPTQALRVAQAAYEIDPAHVPPSVEQVLIDTFTYASKEKSAFYKNILRHKDAVTSAIYSPDGAKLVTTSTDGTAKLWDKNGKLLQEMEHLNENKVPETITHAAFTHNGQKIITVGYGHLVKMWDAEGKYLKDLIGHGCRPEFINFCNVNKVAVAPDDRTIVTVSSDQNVIMWNGAGEKLKTLEEHTRLNGWVNTVAFSPDGKYFATAGGDWDTTVQLYKANGDHIARLPQDGCPRARADHWNCGTFDIAFSPDGQSFLTASDKGTIRMYDLESKLPKTLTTHSARVNSLAFSPTGQFFLSASNDRTAIVWTKEGSVKQILKGHTDAVTRAVFSPDGDYIVTASKDKTAKLWDLEGNVLATYPGHQVGIDAVVFSPDGEDIVTASGDKTARLWRVQPMKAPVLQPGGEVVTARFLPDGKRILTASNDMTVRLWHADDTTTPPRPYEMLFGPDSHSNRRIYSLDISPDGKRFITTGTDYTVRMWDVETGGVINAWEDRAGCNSTGWCGATNARYSYDGTYIVTSDFGGVVKIFDHEGKSLKSFQAHKDEVNGITISRDNKHLVTGSHDKTIKLWDFKTGKLLQKPFAGHTKAVLWVNFSDKGDRIVSGSDDPTVKLWDLQGKVVLDIDAHAGPVRSVEFSLNGQQILSSSMDGTAKIWDMRGRLVKLLTGHKNYLRSASFSPTGDQVITASGDQTALIWPSAAWVYHWLRDAAMYKLTSEDRKKLGIEDH